MKRKVLVIGPSFFGYCRSIADGFDALGWESRVYQYDEPVHPFNWKNKLLRKVYPSNPLLLNASRERVNREAREAYDGFNPELVFVYNGDALTAETVGFFRAKSKVAIWLLDGAYKSPRSVALAGFVDAYFCFEKNDLSFPSLLGTPSYFLPQGYDPKVYYPLSGVRRDIDVLFVGALYGYPERVALLRPMVERLKRTYAIQIYGVYKPVYKMPLQWLFREERSIFQNRNISPAEVNRLYNRAKVCVNIHHHQSTCGANPKVFEIPATGAFQVVDDNPYIRTLYEDRDVLLFDPASSDDFVERVERALSDKLYDRPSEPLLETMQQHTFSERVREALSVLYPGL